MQERNFLFIGREKKAKRKLVWRSEMSRWCDGTVDKGKTFLAVSWSPGEAAKEVLFCFKALQSPRGAAKFRCMGEGEKPDERLVRSRILSRLVSGDKQTVQQIIYEMKNGKLEGLRLASPQVNKEGISDSYLRRESFVLCSKLFLET